MPGRLQRNAIRDGLECGKFSTPSGRFEARPNRKHPERIRCVLCHVTGYGPLDPDYRTAAPWQLVHMLTHRFPCGSCEMQFVSPGMYASHSMNVHGCDVL